MRKPWLDHNPTDVPAEISCEQFKNLGDFFEQQCQRFSERTAFVNMGYELSYAQLEEQSRHFSAYLRHELKLEKGTRVGLMMPNLLQYPIALFGVLRAGLVAVNINPLYTARELEHQLVDSEAEVIVVVDNFASTLEAVVKKTQVKHVIMTRIGDMLALPKRTLVNFVVKYVKRMVPSYHLPDAKSFRYCLKLGAEHNFLAPEIKQSDMAFLQYTGGTTGVAKGAILSHAAILTNVVQVFGHFAPRTLYQDEKVVTPLPLYHIFANTVSLMLVMYLGGSNLLITNPRDMDGFIGELKKYPFTLIFGLNTLFVGLLRHPEFSKLDFSTYRLAIAGGMSTQESVAKQWHEVTGSPIIEGYGLTECAPVVAAGMHTEQAFVPGIGVPMPSTLIKIVDSNEQELATGELGELWIKGPQLMDGYWKREQDSAEAITADGWFRSGDMGYMDERGRFYVVDRSKDMLLVSGFNVYPSEIEEILMSHPEVKEAAVIGVDDDITGQTVKAVLVLKGPPVNEKELKQFCRKQLTAYKVPRLYEFRDELPKSAVGKVLKKNLQ
ncbi:long-chain-fatty-acid--CoA ligase [Alginatibacterium sediminis]|uniref:Long-chain-fatty-acid--CoA ligase n=1 Tax=Alginatibacterium sediminis TaxID=2164068 RepID=A0A420E6Z9_9ALTE|nr:AMP-binding protein [Alginatibacterium sediminis]RKF14332.1 long-chain-fatty-acid--CoA ligase [Alginatibacterium sediminis]